MTVLVALLAGVAGIVVGAVVNALADDLPQEERSLRPPHYPDATPRPVMAWSGLAAFLSGRRASPAGARLSWRHPVVEVVLAVAYAALTLSRPLDVQWLFVLLFLAVLTLITVIDLEHRLILFVVIVPACLLAILESALVPNPPPDLGDALIGGMAGFAIFFVIFLGGLAFSSLTGTSEVAFGFGDVMLGMLSGLLLGWRAFLFALMITVLLGAAGALLYLVVRLVRGGRYAMFTALPYGPYIVIGTLIMMLWRDEVRALLLR